MASETTANILGHLVMVSKGFRFYTGKGQWHRHDTVRCNGRVIGQVIVRNVYCGERLGFQLRTETAIDGSPMKTDGLNLEWLVRQQEAA